MDEEAGGSPRKDVSPARAKAWEEIANVARVKLFETPWDPNRIHLLILRTIPAYQRRGYGAALCRWGMAKAKEAGVVVSLFGSQMGFRMYRAIGFRDLGAVVIRAPGEEESITVNAMLYNPNEEEVVGV